MRDLPFLQHASFQQTFHSRSQRLDTRGPTQGYVRRRLNLLWGRYGFLEDFPKFRIRDPLLRSFHLRREFHLPRVLLPLSRPLRLLLQPGLEGLPRLNHALAIRAFVRLQIPEQPTQPFQRVGEELPELAPLQLPRGVRSP